uniref:Exocyst complex component Sec6 n=1 Tax=Steinernema glaseri TaxID=37863 RepID=A0A1I7YWW6_9BILA
MKHLGDVYSEDNYADLSFYEMQSRIVCESIIEEELDGVLDKSEEQFEAMWRENMKLSTDYLENTIYRNQTIGDICEYVTDLERWKIRLLMSKKLEKISDDMEKLRDELMKLSDENAAESSECDLLSNVDENAQSVERCVFDNVLTLVSDYCFTFEDARHILGDGVPPTKQTEEPKEEDHTIRAMRLQYLVCEICKDYTDEQIEVVLVNLKSNRDRVYEECIARVEKDSQEKTAHLSLSIDIRTEIAKNFGSGDRAARAVCRAFKGAQTV